MPKPTKELKSTPFTEVIELKRIVTWRRKRSHFCKKKENLYSSSWGFATEEIARFDVAWPEEPKEEIKDSTKVNEEVEITVN